MRVQRARTTTHGARRAVWCRGDLPEPDEICRLDGEKPGCGNSPHLAADAIARGLEAGALDYIVKPFEPLELLARVRTHLALHRSRTQERKLVKDLQAALEQGKQLSGLLPICAGCKKVRDDNGFWQQVERYIADHSEATFSHGLCPDCIPIYFPDFKGSVGSGRSPSDR